MEEQAVNNPIQQPNILIPPEQKHHSFLKSKLFLITLVIVVLFTIVYAGIYLYLGSQLDQISKSNQAAISTQPTPTPDPTANWKTYVNQQYGIAFRYPREWEVIKRNVKNMENLGELGEPDVLDFRAKSDQKYPPVTLLIYSNNKDLSLEKFQEELRKEVTAGDSIPLWRKVDTEIVNPNGITTYYGNEKYCGTYQCRRYTWEGNNKIFELILYHDYVATYNQIFDQILSTFKFTDQEDQVVCTLDAKLCPDGSYVSRQGPNCEFAKCP